MKEVGLCMVFVEDIHIYKRHSDYRMLMGRLFHSLGAVLGKEKLHLPSEE